MARFDWHVRADLKPRNLELLVAIDDLRSLVKVAEYLNITQPAVSKSLGQLERSLEVQLFDRGPRGMVPTQYGECLVRHARALLTDYRKARDELAWLSSGGGGSVGVGALPAALPVLVPRAVSLLKRDAPTTTVVLREGTFENLMPDLQTGRLDLVAGTLPPAHLTPGIERRLLLQEDPIVLVSGSHHPLARRRSLEWKDLACYPWIVPPYGASMREPLNRLLAENGLEIPVDRVESVSFTANKTLLQESLSVGFFSRRIAEHYRELGLMAILPLEVTNLVGPVGVMWVAGKPLLPAAQAMLEALADVARHYGLAADAVDGPADSLSAGPPIRVRPAAAPAAIP